MLRKRLPALVTAVLLSLTGCRREAPTLTTSQTVSPETTAAATIPPAEATTLPPETAPPDSVEVFLSGMTLRQEVGQLFLVRPEALTPPEESGGPAAAMTAGMAEMLSRYPVGGVVQFGENIVSPEQITAFNRDLQASSTIPLFIGVDEEGGAVARLANSPGFDLPKYQSAAAVGGGDPPDARDMGVTIGGYLKEYGFNLDFAPVADVNTNPDNPIIGTRAFSSDPDRAADMAEAMAAGLREAGIIPTFKHFPGHGDTAEDSHAGLAVNHKTEEALRACEWIPFQRAGEWDLIMVGHIALPEVTGDDTPASLSKRIVTGILREELGFSGLAVTDSLEMGAVAESYGPGEAALAALEAGCDLILMPEDLPAAFEAVCDAVQSGEISAERLHESVRRVLEYKINYGILTVS